MQILFILLGFCLMFLGYRLFLDSEKRFKSDDPNKHRIDYVHERWKGDPGLVKAEHQVKAILFGVFLILGGILITLYNLMLLIGVKINLS